MFPVLNPCTAEKICDIQEGDKVNFRPGPEVIKLFSCSTQLSIKFQLLTKSKKAEKLLLLLLGFSCFQTLKCSICQANKC